MTEPSIPTVGGSRNTWGTQVNQYLDAATADRVSADWFSNPADALAAAGDGRVLEFTPTVTYEIDDPLDITTPVTMLDGVMPATLTTGGALIQPSASFNGGPLLKININAGSKGAWARNLRLDGKGQVGVTAGVEYAYGTISAADLDHLAIMNVPTGIKTGTNQQSYEWNRVYATVGIDTALDIGADSRHITARSCRFGGADYGAIIGADSSASADRTETVIFDGCEIYAVGTASTAAVLLRQSENTRFLNCYIEIHSSQVTPVTGLVVLGTATANAKYPVFSGCRFGANVKADHYVHMVNASYPSFFGNGSDDGLSTGTNAQIKNDVATAAGYVIGMTVDNPDGMQLVIGDPQAADPQIKTPLRVEYNGQSLYATNGTQTQFAIDSAGTADYTAATLLVNIGGTLSSKRVQIGAADSGGAGYRLLRVAN